MKNRATGLGVGLRPHMKTAKCLEVGKIASMEDFGPVTVSTLAETAYFAAAGCKDITLAVGITPHKLAPLADLQRRYSVEINLLCDNLEVARAVGNAAQALRTAFSIFIEIDCGGGRGGLDAKSSQLVALAQMIGNSDALSLAGVLTHAGQSYRVGTFADIVLVAEAERSAATTAAERLRDAGIAVPIVSVGSTPTTLAAQSLAGVDEIRPGVYMFFDLDQFCLGVCDLEDIAMTVLATVIGHNPRSKRLLLDAGSLALSKDQSAGNRCEGFGYGLVFSIDGERRIEGAIVDDVHQEHGFVAGPGNFDDLTAAFPIGSRVRILPNHACMTAAPYDRYHIVRTDDQRVIDIWSKVRGW
jgi:D-serine deaminase-like pyridoxal phosphate-dependent protein